MVVNYRESFKTFSANLPIIFSCILYLNLVSVTVKLSKTQETHYIRFFPGICKLLITKVNFKLMCSCGHLQLCSGLVRLLSHCLKLAVQLISLFTERCHLIYQLLHLSLDAASLCDRTLKLLRQPLNLWWCENLDELEWLWLYTQKYQCKIVVKSENIFRTKTIDPY